jgi:hypothetical protein
MKIYFSLSRFYLLQHIYCQVSVGYYRSNGHVQPHQGQHQLHLKWQLQYYGNTNPYTGKSWNRCKDGYTSKEQVLLIVRRPVIHLQLFRSNLQKYLHPSTYSTPTTYSSQVIVRPKPFYTGSRDNIISTVTETRLTWTINKIIDLSNSINLLTK